MTRRVLLKWIFFWCFCGKDMFPGNVSLAQKYLEEKVSSGGLSNYSLCLVAYALSLANSPVAGTALTELSRRADYRGNLHTLFSLIQIFVYVENLSCFCHLQWCWVRGKVLSWGWLKSLCRCLGVVIMCWSWETVIEKTVMFRINW